MDFAIETPKSALRTAFMEIPEDQLVELVKMKVANDVFGIITLQNRDPMLTDEQQVQADLNKLANIADWPIVINLEASVMLEVLAVIKRAQLMISTSDNEDTING